MLDTSLTNVRQQLAPLCPTPMSKAKLLAGADYVEAHPDALPFMNEAFRLSQEASICRTGAAK